MASADYNQPAGDQALKADLLSNAARAVELAPKDANALTHVAFALNSAHLRREALRHARRALQLNPNHGVAHGALAFAQVGLGMNEEALANLDINRGLTLSGDIGFAIDPGHPGVLAVRASLCSPASRHADAADAVRSQRTVIPGARQRFMSSG